MHGERRTLAQQGQPEEMVQVAIGQQYAGNPAFAPAVRAGMNPGKRCIWNPRSGDAFTRNHDSPSALTATPDCVRRGSVPRRAASHPRQAQFH